MLWGSVQGGERGEGRKWDSLDVMLVAQNKARCSSQSRENDKLWQIRVW